MLKWLRNKQKFTAQQNAKKQENSKSSHILEEYGKQQNENTQEQFDSDTGKQEKTKCDRDTGEKLNSHTGKKSDSVITNESDHTRRREQGP